MLVVRSRRMRDSSEKQQLSSGIISSLFADYIQFGDNLLFLLSIDVAAIRCKGTSLLGSEGLSFNDEAQIMSEVLGKPVRFQQIAGSSLEAALLQSGRSEAIIRDSPPPSHAPPSPPLLQASASGAKKCSSQPFSPEPHRSRERQSYLCPSCTSSNPSFYSALHNKRKQWDNACDRYPTA